MKTLKQKLFLDARFDFQVSLRVWWSMFWRSMLFVLVIGMVFNLFLPLPEFMKELKNIPPEIKDWESIKSHTEEILRKTSVFSVDYIYYMMKTYLPMYLASVLAASAVFQKSYQHFTLQLVNREGVVLPARWRPAFIMALVYRTPSILLLLLVWISKGIFGTMGSSSSVVMFLTLFLNIMLELYGSHLALYWPYKKFSVVVSRKNPENGIAV